MNRDRVRRENILSFRASLPEAVLFRALAAARNSTVSDLIRDLALQEARRISSGVTQGDAAA